MLKLISELFHKNGFNIEIKNIQESNNFDPNFIESQAFAYLVARFFKNLPSAFPMTTGCRNANVCGCLAQAI